MKSADEMDRPLVAAICIFLVAIVWAAFGRALGYGFINYDDDIYIYQNPTVLAGLTWRGFWWAFTFAEIGHWHPVTWLSHMLDCFLFGLRAGGHHLTNVALHAVAAILLFSALRKLTGAFWRSAFVAALFAVHPQRVESVVWIAERKDVLSGVFFMLTLLAYVRYVRMGPSLARYALMLVLFALGLMSKGMLVTLPFVLLLLDYWPLGRFQSGIGVTAGRLFREKIPLFVLSALSCVATTLSPEKIAPAFRESLVARMENAVVSYVIYLKQMFRPTGLTLPYFNPPAGFPLWQVFLALGLLIAVTIAVWVLRKTQPYLLVGWLWYLGMLLPVIGIVQISYYARADRYTYLPQIGIYLMATWGMAETFQRWRGGRRILAVAGLVLIAALVVQTRAQAAHWRDSETLWRYVLEQAPRNYIAHSNLGLVLDRKGEIDSALRHYETALQIEPAYAEAHNNLGNTLSRAGRLSEAIAHFKTALDLVPDLAQVHNNLGVALAQGGQLTEARGHFEKALEINAVFAGAENNLGYSFLVQGDGDEAVPHFRKALEINPGAIEPRKHLAGVLLKKGRAAEAMEHYRKLIELRGDDAEAHLGLANANAELKNFPAAREAANRALEKAQAAGDDTLTRQIEQRLSVFRQSP